MSPVSSFCVAILLKIVLPATPVPLSDGGPPSNHTVEDEMLDEVMESDIFIPRSFLTERQVLWPVSSWNGKPVLYVPYVADQVEPVVLRYLQYYIREFSSKSCVQWVERSNQKTYVTITSVLPQEWSKASPNICRGSLGYTPSYAMYLYVSDKCLHIGTYNQILSNIPHEMMHNLGFIHEQQRTDRDCYIYITGHYVYDKVNYGVYWEHTTDESFPYDTTSVMQYPSWADQLHSKFGDELGPINDSLSWLDWMKLNYLYCGGPHVCDVYPDFCKKHQQIKERCRRNTYY